ncbi:hypothetical protein B0H63DRAFT_466329 [Podospora didyma]|uniref:Uncharacterized protein n=1 Tax=Podospora didyma TaxID=330526 RepID=A0AAE0NZS2_9PEZI|nr:hypothetical protein B0H63DRAFT_466329 [Podospora didyma]
MPSLQSLPFELIQRIADSLCLHCTPLPQRCEWDIPLRQPDWKPRDSLPVSSHCGCRRHRVYVTEARVHSSALAALCLTSKRLRDAAARPLYHRPNTSKWWLLARTLLARPDDLARDVKELFSPESFVEPEDESHVSPQVRAYLTSLVDAHVASMPEGYRREYLRLRAMNDKVMSMYDTDKISLITTLCPNAETIEAVVWFGDIFCFSAPNSLPRLHTVELVEGDTEGGIEVTGSLLQLWKAAPNLQVIRGTSMSQETAGEGRTQPLGVVLDKVKVVEFENSTISAEALALLLKLCPKLETFYYSAGDACVGYEQFDPSQAKELLLWHGNSLKKVELDLGRWDCWEEWDMWEEDDEADAIEAFEERGVEFKIEYKPRF